MTIAYEYHTFLQLINFSIFKIIAGSDGYVATIFSFQVAEQ